MKIKNSMADEPELLELLKKGESKGFKEIYLKTFRSVKHYVVDNSGRSEDAEDIFQDSLIALLNNIRKTDFQLSTSIENYFLSIVRNLWLGQLKKRKIRNVESLDSLSEQWMNVPEEDLETMVLENERQEKLYRHFENLGEDCKKLLTGFYYSHQSLDELSKIMNYTYDFIKVKKFRCMKELRNKLIS
jgi:RNA polymerase sigma factor (sigma-70 family)